LLTRRWPEAVEEELAARHDLHRNESDRPMSRQELAEAIRAFDVVCPTVSDRIDAEVIGRGGGARILANYGAGIEHIDLAAARAAGIAVTNTPDVLTDATADIALLLMLGAARRAYEGERAVREGGWKSWSTTYMLGVHMTGKRLGIFGMGRIGQAVAKRARAFDMKIHYSNRRRLAAELEQGAIFHADPEEMLAHCDFLSINAPGGAETYHWLNAERIAKLPDGAVVVNTARGALVDDAALIAALKSGKVFAAGLDVFENEPNLNPAYRELQNVFLLPHLGSATVETRNAMGFKALDNLDAFFAGKPLPDRVV
jgi:lactate dehydrogenase-like 2-hydroxyacid dehydrogenase